MTDPKIWLGFLLGIIGTTLGAWLAHFFSERRRRQDDFNKAADKFRVSFMPEIIFLRHNAKINGGSSNDLNEFLRAAYLRQLESITIFKNSLSPEKRKGIDAAWKEYCHHPDNTNIPWFEQYSWKVQGKGKSSEESLKKLALERIEKILKFAE